jgi:hypothetical protein
MPLFTDAIRAFPAVLDAIPKGKYAKVQDQAVAVESYLRKSAAMLDTIRRYFLEHAGGEESPFVARIDELVPRRS